MSSTDDLINSPIDDQPDGFGAILEQRLVNCGVSDHNSLRLALVRLRRFIESGMPEETIELVEGELANVLREEDKYAAIAEAFETQAKFFQKSMEEWKAIPANDPLRKYAMPLVAENSEIAKAAIEKAKEYKHFADTAKQQH